MAKDDGEEGIRVYLRIRPPPTSQQSRLLATGAAAGTTTNAGPSPSTRSPPKTCEYEVEEDFNKSVLHLHTTQRLLQDAQRSAGAGPSSGAADSAVPDDVINNTIVDFRYRFDRVFKPSATQEDVFNTVAKGCVASVLDGLNSTVFAYGQTGSGKTYSITGGTESYQDRGLIPRAMAMIYDEVARRRDSAEDASTTYTITMSYLQIYNDKGQDLLNHGHDARTLEELPPVTIHEMENDILLKGLEQHSAPTLSDALNLLFLGDTNRLYCETPMNKTSSRSHCIFTVYIEARSTASSTVRRSKLNLVDLAGSERVSKTGVSGTILTEAKHINLSLHFLEQVIVALSEKAKGVRDHIPYRNSFLTMVLRDSLGRNCKTAMLATAHVVASQVAETISTCQFAQRVAMIRQAPQVNVETDPALLVKKLKAEVAQLKDEVAHLRANGGGGGGDAASAMAAADRVLSDDEKNVCRGMVEAYIQRAAVEGDWDSRLTGFHGDMARMYYCYDVLRERLIKGGGGSGSALAGKGRRSADGAAMEKADEDAAQHQQQQQARLQEAEGQVATLRQSLQLKENELQMLLTVLKRAGANGSGVGGGGIGSRYNAPTQTANTAGHASAGETGEALVLFDDSALSGAEVAALRQKVYSDAQVLIHRLRQSAHAAAAETGGSSRSAADRDGAPAAAAAVTDGVGAAAPLSRAANAAAAQAALTRVTTLAQQGQLTEAEAAAATAFLESKKGLRPPSASSRRASQHDEGGGDGSLGDSRSAVDVLLDDQLVQDRAQALEAFKATYEAQHKVEETKQLLKPKYDACKSTAQQLNACVDSIKQLKTKIQRRRAERAADGSDTVDAEESAWLEELRATKEAYNTHAAQLRHAKEEIDGMHAYLKHAQEQLVRDFERWFSARQQQVHLAVQQQQRQQQQQQSRTAAKQAALMAELRSALHVADDTTAETAVSPAAGAARGEDTTPLLTRSDGDGPTSAAAATAAGGVEVVHMSSSGSDGVGFQTLSAPPPAASLPRAYPSSAPVQSSSSAAAAAAAAVVAASARTASANNNGGGSGAYGAMERETAAHVGAVAVSASFDPPHFAASAREGSRLASLPAPSPSDGESRHHTQPQPHSSSARTLEHARLGDASPAANGAAAHGVPLSHSMGLAAVGGKVNGWVGPVASLPPTAAATTTMADRHSVTPGGAAVLSSSPSRPFHLQPLQRSEEGPRGLSGLQDGPSRTSSPSPPPTVAGVSRPAAGHVSATAEKGGAGLGSNPYFPQFPSTGNAAADQQLAQLYKAREAMRKQLQ